MRVRNESWPFDHKRLFLHYLIVKDYTQFRLEQFSSRVHSTTRAPLCTADELMPLEIHYSSQEAITQKVKRKTQLNCDSWYLNNDYGNTNLNSYKKKQLREQDLSTSNSNDGTGSI